MPIIKSKKAHEANEVRRDRNKATRTMAKTYFKVLVAVKDANKEESASF
jgi:ribosomal protein S20